ncbi:MAG: DUF4406 domain-containing protein [Prevotella sp.]|nr:DUF4406 domain-containing protein [Prevotella sp.]MBR6195108.1 DUF4406 domain-containing protein [Prevotella sp.]
MRVYISGKIGEEVISEATRQKFERAERMLEEHFNPEFDPPVNPASEAFQDTMRQVFERRGLRQDLPNILLYDLHWLRRCDAIYMLEDWTKSDGANVELDFARATGKKILWQNLEDAQIFHDDNETAEGVWLPIDEEEGE